MKLGLVVYAKMQARNFKILPITPPKTDR